MQAVAEEHLGETLKAIRQAKHLSLREVAGEQVSIAQLSRFERGLSTLSVFSFYHCLTNMDLDFADFQYLLTKFQAGIELEFEA